MSNRLLVLVSLLISGFHRTLGQYDDNNYIFPRKEGEYKFVVAVTSRAGICTGTILNQNWILTAAHCLYSRGKVIGGKDAKIQAGIINYEVARTSTKYDTMSSNIVVHPDFWYGRIAKFDVALVSLRDPIEFDEYKGPIAIAADGWPQTPNKTLDCMTLGFGGYRSTAPPTKDLKVWNVTAGHGEEACPCARRFQYKRLICVKELHYPQTCKADDGGPLVCGNVVRGIVHMIWDSMKCDEPTYPLEKCMGGPVKGLSTYTFLCPLNDWIHSIVMNDSIPQTPKSCKASGLSRRSFLVYLFVHFIVYFGFCRK